MFKKVLFIALALVMAGFGTQASAGPVFDFGGALNEVFFRNREVVLRADASSLFGDLVGWRRVTGLTADPFAVGDISVSIFNAQNLEVDGTQTWAFNPGLGVGGAAVRDLFEGYGVTRISSLTPPATHGDPTLVHITQGASLVDPFGIISAAELAAGVTLKLYHDSATEGGNTFWTNLGASSIGNVASVTDGTLWAAFGLGVSLQPQVGATPPAFLGSGFAYAHILPGGRLAFFQFNRRTLAGTLSTMVPFPGVNHPSETEIGGSGHLTDIYASTEIENNPQGRLVLGGAATSLWDFSSNDPFAFRATPEPSSIILFGIGFPALGLRARRRKRTEA